MPGAGSCSWITPDGREAEAAASTDIPALLSAALPLVLLSIPPELEETWQP